ncbi:replication factor C large subunit [Candidatus Woesearchaeota archaeon]|nr:replication factor C large subunit [Candidatus Woesearchaeota archaeon]
MEPWVIKYRPRQLSDIQGQDSAVTRLKDFVLNFRKQKNKAALLYGPTGCGKTAAVYALANEFDYEVIEINASDARNKDAIEQKLGPAIRQQSLFSKGKIILVEEIDGIAGRKDRGGLQTVNRLMSITSFPIIFTANDPWDSKFSTLRRKSEMIEFRTLAYTSVRAVLRSICGNEQIKYNDMALTMLSRHAAGDLRGAITDLQTLAQYSRTLSKEAVDEISARRKTDSMINALMRVLKTTNPEIALKAYDNVEEDHEQIFLWLDENLPKEYSKTEDIAKAYENMSLADVYRGRIRRWQHWRFLVYIYNLLSAGVAISKIEKYHGFTKYARPKRIFKIWQANRKFAKRKSIAEKIAENTHTSVNVALKETLPYVETIFKKNKQMAEHIAEELQLDKEEIIWLRR